MVGCPMRCARRTGLRLCNVARIRGVHVGAAVRRACPLCGAWPPLTEGRCRGERFVLYPLPDHPKTWSQHRLDRADRRRAWWVADQRAVAAAVGPDRPGLAA